MGAEELLDALAADRWLRAVWPDADLEEVARA